MKKIVLLILSLITLSPYISKANSFIMQQDTVTMTVDSGANVYDFVINTSNNPVTLKWHVTGSTFPSDWLTPTAFGICDNSVCYYNTGDTALWNATTNTGHVYTSAAYTANDTGDFHMVLDLTNATTCGTYTMTVSLSDPSTFSSQVIVFIITKQCNSSVPTILNTAANKIILYPNPATQSTVALFNLQHISHVQLAVYDVVGRLVYNTPLQTMSEGNQQMTIPTANLITGLYSVWIRTENNVFTQQLSVIK